MQHDILKSDPNYYPRIKARGKWYLIVPEVRDPASGCVMCDFYKDGKQIFGTSRGCEALDESRHSCGFTDTIYVSLKNFNAYNAYIIKEKFTK